MRNGEKRVSMKTIVNRAWSVALLALAGGAYAATEATDASKTVVVVSSDNPKISGQLFHPKICPNMVNYVAFAGITKKVAGWLVPTPGNTLNVWPKQ